MLKIKNILFLLFITLSYSLHAENIPTDTLKIEINNAAPRVGDKVELSFETQFLNDEIKKQLPEGAQLAKMTSVFGEPTSSKLKKIINFQKSGKYTVGPFSFEFNGTKMITNSIEVYVAEALPFEPGIWIRYVETATEKYIIVEQLLGNKSDYKKTDNGFSYTVGGVSDKDELADIILNPTEGLEIRMRNGIENTRSKGGDIFAPGLTYSFKKYLITTTEEFKGKFKLKEKHLKNLPKKIKVEIDAVEINN
ncbi:hypothetical protein Fleli_2856 [Bernardetia litoralis DSM 6794]|uniref:Oxygen tolerance n=1 Tax=Bernardetia litoralis (strain ATCC 23117 / DSM 6794 / NBRC 15988 / NCIMB 1366 / Fx l1 / Sio-4) TaxID=880071 RepID=I4AMM4_BERLS|nr:hypothetical protein [Bernardetia litoralis]AFM05209.1 hypothetical protein Fleli_2856 [Bernardetia litoralis DSM 6794]